MPTVDAVGDCPVCGRQSVDLKRYRGHDGTERIACTDEHACLTAYILAHPIQQPPYWPRRAD